MHAKCAGGFRALRRGARVLLIALLFTVIFDRANGKNASGRRPREAAGAKPSGLSGGMAEWSKAAVLKTVEPQGSGGSNPSPSANVFPLRGEVTEWLKVHAC